MDGIAVVVTVRRIAYPPPEAISRLASPAGLSPVDDARELEEAALETARAGVAHARRLGLAAEPASSAATSPDDVAEALVDAAVDHRAHSVVVGQRGVGRVRAALTGSVSDAAVRDGRPPVLVVPAEDA